MAAQASNKDGPNGMERRLSKLEEYLYANLMVWCFLAVVAVISFFTCGGVWDDVTSGVIFKFLFLIVGGGMALVSVIDYFCDWVKSESMEEEKK